ncbi:hypothetical protein FH972_005705 [Carpinus fangiana]|uniref:Uncharacterized protein n=1 Tax=Carpinus fangiana TaxID=176857 RepID=A0A5N6QQ25_9ROSI|nr:hypothetical protein FH972_005705 [Carpinus fangiana]
MRLLRQLHLKMDRVLRGLGSFGSDLSHFVESGIGVDLGVGRIVDPGRGGDSKAIDVGSGVVSAGRPFVEGAKSPPSPVVSKEVLPVIKEKDPTMEVGSSVPTISMPVIPPGIVPSLPEDKQGVQSPVAVVLPSMQYAAGNWTTQYAFKEFRPTIFGAAG